MQSLSDRCLLRKLLEPSWMLVEAAALSPLRSMQLDVLAKQLRNYSEWKWTMRSTACPECGGMAPVANVIAHLNDKHRWNRGRIARWVAAIEPTEENSSDGEEFAS